MASFNKHPGRYFRKFPEIENVLINKRKSLSNDIRFWPQRPLLSEGQAMSWNSTSSTTIQGRILEATAGKAAEGREEEGDGWLWDDATWILCASFIIFTMQTGKQKIFQP